MSREGIWIVPDTNNSRVTSVVVAPRREGD